MISLTTPLVISLVLSSAGVVVGVVGLAVAIRRKMMYSAMIIGVCLMFFFVSLMIRVSTYWPWFHAMFTGGMIVAPE